jgi:hypothetical protein
VGAQSTSATAPAGATTRNGAEGDPAITTQNVGLGHLVFVSTAADADPEWTFLPAKPVYVSLVHELLLGTVTPGDQWLNLEVGQSLQIPANIKLAAAPTLADPAQRPVVLDEARGDDGRMIYRSRPLAQPGVYRLETGARQYPVAVNVPGDEADVRTLNDAALQRALGGIQIDLEGDELPPVAAAVSDGNDYGWSFMLAVLALVGLESLLAMRFGHYRR